MARIYYIGAAELPLRFPRCATLLGWRYLQQELTFFSIPSLRQPYQHTHIGVLEALEWLHILRKLDKAARRLKIIQSSFRINCKLVGEVFIKKTCMQKFNVQKFHTFYAKMMIFFNGDGFKLGRLEKRVPNLLHTLFMKVHEIYQKVLM